MNKERSNRAFATEQERQNVYHVHAACFAKETKNESILDAAKALIHEVGKDLLPKDRTAIPLDKAHFIGANDKDRENKTYAHSFHGFGVDLGEVVLGFCIVQGNDKASLAELESKIAQCNHLSNVLIMFIDKEQMVVQLWKGKQKQEVKLGKDTTKKEIKVNQVVTTIRRFFQVNRSIQCSPQQLADDLASKALLFKSIAERELLLEFKSYKAKIKAQTHREGGLISQFKTGKISDFWDDFPLLKLYFTFHTRLMTMETSSADEHRKEGLSIFSDVYAQTISYGLLAARWMSKDKEISFSRTNIQSLLPSTSDFLKEMFVELIAVNAGGEVEFCIQEIFSALYQVDISAVFAKKKDDPVIHFYEHFLDAYGKDVKKSRGVYYTPDEVVDFMIRSIDEQLKAEFGLPLGLASTKTWDQVLAHLNTDKDEEAKVRLPNLAKGTDFFVHILDPATGTGTFIKRVLGQIRTNLKAHWRSLDWSLEQMQAEWNAYVSGKKGVEKDYTGQGLLSRLHAFELMMAPYIITHLRMGLLLQEDKELPFEFGESDRLNVFRTNALEHPDDRVSQSDLPDQMDAISVESHHADVVKQKTAITVVLGNPPYNGISSNNTKWITHQIEQYKYVDGVHFHERKHWLNDDYVRFIRYGELFIERSTIGVLGYVNPHGFLDNPTFRGMRWQLLSTFSNIYVLDLHGNVRKKEVAPDGAKDENIFDIMQGVSINVFSLTSVKQKDLGKIHHSDIFGLRDRKASFLTQNILSSIQWKSVPTHVYSRSFDLYFMVPKDFANLKRYAQGFSLDELFHVYTSGVVTARDSVVIDLCPQNLKDRIQRFYDLTVPDEVIRAELFPGKKEKKYLAGDTRGWKLSLQRRKKANVDIQEHIQHIAYRPFDCRYVYYSSEMVDWGREEVMQHFINGENLGLVFKRGDVERSSAPTFLTNSMIDFRSWSRPGMQGGDYVAPLYRYENEKRVSNVNPTIVEQFQTCVPAREDAIVYYVYAMTHSRKYFEMYADFLSFEYPRIPYPNNAETFQKIVAKGKELRHIHLMETKMFANLPSTLRNADGSVATTSQEVTQYRPNGKSKKDADKAEGWKGQVWINDTQYFEGVSELVWNFYIGGYQPAQKWLKDRKGRKLTADEVTHYSKIVKALNETNRIMKEIDQIALL